MTNDGEALVVEYADGRKMCFDCKMKTKQGFALGAIIQPMRMDDTVSESDLKTISEKRFHEMSTHQWEGMLKEMARNVGHKLTGGIGHCDHCIRGKMQRNPSAKKWMTEI